ncbi:acetyltransferase [Mammaliicoccus lentus]|jgi:RimJ/RimL family protein N-acetyltransferase|uniref:GNAT family N-acetyltransferase n=1 Tax=Mammaliicoccus TaxID=2803850 RepID=UPI0007D91B10|nr:MULTISPECIES: GNAT family N-acetyltransferase [Mammaliicoccus]MBF0748134.1 GNAT family N-acetyltransferase [Mammaliicoccus lentus]MBF0794223.1 GNAT family N-acetyltransferase [Mammaliicoccus lentus]MBW0762133.1 GNAT family N-acetyltransferase [Mammaliicoccus lentus]MBW0769726.1 GNAT family N-acetyltransferase [Mammaliicoccus lentus]MCD2477124.1 GNAT family N-acetyltransferase [Mammaliicoccus lentus]
MIKEKQFGDIFIKPFEESMRTALSEFQLNERQQIYSSLPKEVLDEAIQDSDRRPNVVVNRDNEIVGFFVLHKYYQHEGYETPENVVYIRSLSINEKYQGNGYGTTIMMNLPEYVQLVFPDFDHLFLVVDAENEAAWNLYERAGFMHTATKEEGPLGKERLYYLDLDSKYVSSLKLELHDDDYDNEFINIHLMKDNKKVGIIVLEHKSDNFDIRSIEVEESERKEGIAESALRQLSTFVRRKFPDKKELHISLFGSNNKLKALCYKANFVEIQKADDYIKLMKYINY